MLNPVTDFRANPDTMKVWVNTVDSRIMREAVMAAWWEFSQHEAAKPTDLATSAALHWQKEGAKRFLHILMTLADPAPARARAREGDNLEHRL